MKRLFRMLAAATLVAALTATFVYTGATGRVDIAQAQYGGGTPVNVGAFGCIARGGHRTVPAGSTIVIRSGWATSVIGGVHAFMRAQTSLLSVQDGPMIDVSDEHGQPERFTGPFSGWATFLTHPTGVTLTHSGDSMRFTFTLILDNPLSDPSDLDQDGRLDTTRVPEGLVFGGTCTVAAV